MLPGHEKPPDRSAAAPVSSGVSGLRFSGSLSREVVAEADALERSPVDVDLEKVAEPPGSGADAVLVRNGSLGCAPNQRPRGRNASRRPAGLLGRSPPRDHAYNAARRPRVRVVELDDEVDDQAEHPQQPRMVGQTRRMSWKSNSGGSGDGST